MAASGDQKHKHLPLVPYEDSDDDSFYYNDDDVDEDDEVVLGQVEIDDNHPRKHHHFRVLKESDIRQCIEDNIAKVSDFLSISKAEASTLLLHYNWNVHKVHDAWFADEQQARKKAGLVLKPIVEILADDDDDNGDIVCGICFEPYSRDGVKSTPHCGHPYCNDCWRCYIKTAIADGTGSLLLKCPEPSCGSAVGEDMVGAFATEDEKKKYIGYFVMSFIEENKMIKWCPGPGCEYAINFVGDGNESENFNVSCLCSHSFCWNCTQEPHSPVDCETVMKWMSKNHSEAENMNYILVFTKPCPKCKRPIEKSMGCNAMTCRPPCYFQFCWLCLQGLRNHWVCNVYREKERSKNAKKYVMRYTHYFERWATHRKSMQKVAADLQNHVQGHQIEPLGRIQGQAEDQLGFLTEAWEQIVECRRVLTWTYAYGYYLSDEEQAKRNLFEYLQGQAESGLERLHNCAEKEVLPFLKNPKRKEFFEFRQKLSGLTRVTRNYFENLVTALKNGLPDVNSNSQCSSSSSSSSSTVSKKPRIEYWTYDNTSSAAVAFPAAHSFDTNVVNHHYPAAVEPWICTYCTYVNYSSATSCTGCGISYWTCQFCYSLNFGTATTCAVCFQPN
ncbi:hypothetical protein PTKIN_Ptkin07bG0007600 [Pterospermum kingtungense]